jgi:hypothetical protein
MAVFKSLRVKSKEYVLKFGGNDKLKSPARAVFARFPQGGENFFKPRHDIQYRDVNFSKVGEKDEKELEKLFNAFLSSWIDDKTAAAQWKKVDAAAFLKECVDHFENFFAAEDGGQREVADVDGLLSLPYEGWSEIARELYEYAREKDEFSMGE